LPGTHEALLQEMPVFGGIREDALAFLLARAPVRRVPAGTLFFREGDLGRDMFVLESGQALVLKASRGRQLVLRRLGRGDCFGEMALLDLGPRSASVLAVEDATVIELSADAFLDLYRRDPGQFTLIHMNIAREVCRRLRDTDARMLEVALEGAFELGPDLPAPPGASVRPEGS
jgi:CRP-like cAMP-binding protein